MAKQFKSTDTAEFCATQLTKLNADKFGWEGRFKIASNECDSKFIVLNNETASELVKWCYEHYDLDSHSGSSDPACFGGWSLQDVITCAEDRDIKITRQQALDTFQLLQERFDSNRGIDWEFIAGTINDVVVYNEKPKSDPVIVPDVKSNFTDDVPVFPNGFKSWQETHYEIVISLSPDKEGTLCNHISDTEGTVGLYELSKRWTNEFEKIHEGKSWDGNFWETIERFIEERNVYIPE